VSVEEKTKSIYIFFVNSDFVGGKAFIVYIAHLPEMSTFSKYEVWDDE